MPRMIACRPIVSRDAFRRNFFILTPGTDLLNRFFMIQFFSLIFPCRGSLRFHLMKESQTGGCRPNRSVASALQKAVVTHDDIRVGGPKILLHLECGRVQKIIDQNDGGVADKIKRLIDGKTECFSDLPGDLIAFQLAFERVHHHEPILPARLNFFCAGKHTF